MPPPEELPPAAQTFHGKLRGLVRHPDIDEALVATHIVGAVGDRRTFPQVPQVRVVIDIDLQRLSFGTPGLTAFLKFPTRSFFLASIDKTGSPRTRYFFTCRLR
jgi:hypothetical protein